MMNTKTLGALAVSASALAFGGAAQAQTAAPAGVPVVKLCTGGTNGNYAFAGREIAKMMNTNVAKVEVVITGGSADNTKKVASGECQAMIAQEDAVVMMKRENASASISSLATLYNESLHLICGKNSGVESLKDLMGTRKKVHMGEAGSGSWVTWQNMVYAEPKYKSVIPGTEEGLNAAASIEEKEADCMLGIYGLGAPAMKNLDEKYGKRLELVKVRDGDVTSDKLKGLTGDPLYTKTDIPKGAYEKGFAPSSTMGFGGKEISTVSVKAKFIVSSDLPKAVRSELVDAISKARPAIENRVNYLK